MTEDERKRSTSKAYLDSLRNRIVLLEEMLRKSGTEPPPMEQVGDKDNKTSSSSSKSGQSQSGSQNTNTRQASQSPIPRQQQNQLQDRFWYDRQRDGSPEDFKLSVRDLDAMDLRQTAAESHTGSFEELDGDSVEWSIISASTGSASERLPSVPSLSSGEDETAYAAPEYLHSPIVLSGFPRSADSENRFGKKEKFGDRREDWGASLEIESGEAWEGQAALLDMGFMLGLGAEEVFAVQKGMEGIGAADADARNGYSFLVNNDEEVDMDYKLA